MSSSCDCSFSDILSLEVTEPGAQCVDFSVPWSPFRIVKVNVKKRAPTYSRLTELFVVPAHYMRPCLLSHRGRCGFGPVAHINKQHPLPRGVFAISFRYCRSPILIYIHIFFDMSRCRSVASSFWSPKVGSLGQSIGMEKRRLEKIPCSGMERWIMSWKGAVGIGRDNQLDGNGCGCKNELSYRYCNLLQYYPTEFRGSIRYHVSLHNKFSIQYLVLVQ